MTPHTPQILVIDDDEAILSLFQDALTPEYRVRTTPEWLEGTNLLLEEKYDLLILDLSMPVFDSVEYISKLNTDFPRVPILVISAYPNLRERVETLSVAGSLAKPFSIQDLRSTVAQLLTPRERTADVN